MAVYYGNVSSRAHCAPLPLMTTSRPIHWGILSTANIARFAFLPALRAAGGGIPYAVGGRDPGRTRAFAAEHGVEHALDGYAAVIEDAHVDAVYIPLPNSMHAEWTIAALQAGKAVLCEKPLCGTAEQTRAVLDVARTAPRPLWEAFIFPFHEQMTRLRRLLDEGAIGEPREIQFSWHFRLNNPANVRLSAELQGGALRDIGCYGIRLARLVFADEADSAIAVAQISPGGVDEELQGVLCFPAHRRLLLSVGMRGPNEVGARIVGADGLIAMTNPFHPRASDTMEIQGVDANTTESVAGDEPSFVPALRHIHAVLHSQEQPRHLAIDEALGNALAIDLLLSASNL